MLNSKTIQIIIGIFFIFFEVQAQSSAYNIFELTFLYDDARYDQVLKQTADLINNKEILDRQQLIEVLKYRALAFYNIGQQDSSRMTFFSLLRLEKEYSLDPVKTSPKIITFFNSIKDNYEREIRENKALFFNNYIFVEDNRPYAALRSAILPGWGQHYKNQPTKGYIMNGVFAAAVVSGIITYSAERSLREDYLAARNETKIKSLYNDYNNMSKTRRIAQYTAIAIWAYSVIDALYSDYTPLLLTNKNDIILSVNFKF